MSPDLPHEAERFLRELRLGLASLPDEDRDDLCREIRSHLVERYREGKPDPLASFGSADAYAARFTTERALTGALAQGTSFALGRALLIGAHKALITLFGLIPLVVVQLIALGFVFTGLAKPFSPSHSGVFVDGDGHLTHVGFTGGDLGGQREVLGWWGMPVLIGSGIVLAWAANRGMRALAGWRLRSSRGA